MSHHIHSQARTTPVIRQEIRDSALSDRKLAERYNISRSTARKWQQREDTEDRSHRAHTLNTTLTELDEAIVVSLRETLYLPLDDLLYVTKTYINPDVSRSGLARCLKRHGISRLKDVLPQVEDEAAQPTKTFKDYEPGYLHIDIKYLPQMPDEDSRRYLFVAIDRATRWVFLAVYDNMTEASSVDFLKRVAEAAPMKIVKLLTDNGTQFTDRFTSKGKQPTGQHSFDQACDGLGIEHRLSPPRHPQTNGMVERFNGRISELLKQTRFSSAEELEKTLLSYLVIYNHHIPQRAINHQTPIQAVQQWQEDKPELFVKKDYDPAGLDSLGL
jgi:transposase InsO family protein